MLLCYVLMPCIAIHTTSWHAHLTPLLLHSHLLLRARLTAFPPPPSHLQGFTDIAITYSSPRGDDLDSRLLRAMVIKGILENNTTANVNLVNADLLAKNRGIRISEVTIRSDGRWGEARRQHPLCIT
jgi:hypothetical protein